MQIYIVGGAVRDTLLGKNVQDYDYVVVGATPEQLIALGFKPVGKDFPVFLHPISKEEYALARTERKIARGYHGFQFHYAPDVTLEQDLARRDFTINAMAYPIKNTWEDIKNSLKQSHAEKNSPLSMSPHTLIDPFGGLADLQAGILRHVGHAFSEDPVRLLRAARFTARFPTFRIAPETDALMRDMVQAGEVDALVAERVWQEIAIGLMSEAPERLLTTLHTCGALYRLMPEIDTLFGDTPTPSAPSHPLLFALRYAAQHGYALNVRFAILATASTIPSLPISPLSPSATTSTHPSITPAPFISLCTRLKVPNTCRDLASLVNREYNTLARTLRHDTTLEAHDLVTLLERCDAFRKPERLYEALQVCKAYQAVSVNPTLPHSLNDQPYSHSSTLLYTALQAACTVHAGNVAAHYVKEPERIKKAIQEARVVAVQKRLEKIKG